MKVHDTKIQIGLMKNYLGKFIVTPNTLYFLCFSTGSALLQNVGKGLGGVAGGLMKAFADKGKYGDFETFTEDDVQTLMNELPNSIKFETDKIGIIQFNWAKRLIKYDGKTLGFPDGISKEHKEDLRTWIIDNKVKSKGFKIK